ncbi:MAG TPA: hypothetical protein VNT42_07535, partial [Sphingomonas sp.]|nr:hypothetical protein [Sphingomonas sp.]
MVPTLSIGFNDSGVSAPSPAPATSISEAARPKSHDAAARLAYRLDGTSKKSRLEDGHRYLVLGKGAWVSGDWCRAGARCFQRKLLIEVNRREVLSRYKTRLTLIWSAHKIGRSEIEVAMFVNDK